MSEIVERVKFWEEQQRINALLVPRVVETTRTLSSMAGRFQELTTGTMQIEARLERRYANLAATVDANNKGQQNRSDGFATNLRETGQRVESMAKILSRLESELATARESIEKSHEEQEAKLRRVEANLSRLASSIADLQGSLARNQVHDQRTAGMDSNPAFATTRRLLSVPIALSVGALLISIIGLVL
jgi:hypothetical protein